MDCYGIIDFKNEKPILFVPEPNVLYKIWMTVNTKEDFEKKYDIEVRYISELEEFLATECSPSKDATVFVNLGINSDSGLTTQIPEYKYLDGLTVDRDHMHDILAESRIVKNDEEIFALKWATQITVESHVSVMKNVKPGMRESQLESFFKFHGEQNYFTGRVAPYISICGCAHKAATLHYHEADQTIVDGQTMLTDQGHSFHHYVSDVTTCFPVNGKFTDKQKNIYNIVLAASRAVFSKAGPKVEWPEMHKLAERTILEGLVKLGLL